MPHRKIYLISLLILGLTLAATVCSIPAGSSKYKETGRSELIFTEKGWVLQIDLNNCGDSTEKYTVRVSDGGRDIDSQGILLDPGAMFRYSYGAAREEAGTVSFIINRDGGGDASFVQEFYQKI